MRTLPGITTRRLFFALTAVAAMACQAQSREPYQRYARTLPLELRAPAAAQAGQPLPAISIRLQNPSVDDAPDARLRLIIHDRAHAHGQHELGPDSVKVEVLERGRWVRVHLGILDGGVIGAIGEEGVDDHRERHRRGGFPIRAGFDRRWPLRVTFAHPGSYTLLVAVSPDNGSRHLAQPAFAHIEVR